MNSRITVLGLGLIASLALAAAPGCKSEQRADGGVETTTNAGKQLTYETPQATVDALISAARRDDREELRKIFGPDLARLESGERSQDKVDLQVFVAAYDLNHFLYDNGNDTYTLTMGLQEWEFPAPIVKADARWRFDTNAGIDEIITRTIGMNELNVITATAAFAQAQDAYFAMDPDGDSVKSYATILRSSQGKRDGLYWPDEPGQPASPFGPLFAQAVESGQLNLELKGRQPYRGYYYRILTSQAAAAPGGAMNYIDATGRMTKGYALIAWPASYNETGVMCFIVAKDGKVYQRDLGEDTSVEVEKFTTYDPTGWTPVGIE